MDMVTVIKWSTYRCLHFFTIAPYIHNVFLCKSDRLEKNYNLRFKDKFNSLLF